MKANSIVGLEGDIFWKYYEQGSGPNDLFHMCYIMEGIRDYNNFGGKVQINWDSMYKNLLTFRRNGRWYERNSKELQTDKRALRLCSIGVLIYTLSRESKWEFIEKELFTQLNEYKLSEGHFKFKQNDERIMIRQEAQLNFGLSYYLFNKETEFK